MLKGIVSSLFKWVKPMERDVSSLPEYTIRTMKREEIPEALDIWRETGYSEGTHTVETWYQYDPEGFCVAVTDDGTIMGVCAGVLQKNDLAFIGMYAVRPIYRNRGIGIRIWKRVMDRIGERNAGVNPVPDQLANYRDKGGFPVVSPWHSIPCVAEEVSLQGLTLPDGVQVRALTVDDDSLLQDVISYDSSVCGFSRGGIIPLLCSEEDTVTMVALDDGDAVCGYGNIKENIKGNAMVGPLYADSSAVAESILYHLVDSYPLAKSNGAVMMVVDCNEEAMQLTEKLGFMKKDRIARLYKLQHVEADFRKVFGQFNLNFSVF